MAGARRRILVVEDDPETARQILDYLALSSDLASTERRLHLVFPATIRCDDRSNASRDGRARYFRRLREAGCYARLDLSALAESMIACAACAVAATTI